MSAHNPLKRVNILGSLTMCGVGMLYAAYQTISDSIFSHYQQPFSIIGVYIALFFSGNIVSLLVSGEISDRRGKKCVSLWGFKLIIISALLIAYAPHKILLYMGLFLYGGSHGIIEGTVTSALVDENPSFETGISNITQAFFSLGGIISPVICVMYLNHGGSFAHIFVFFSIIFFVLWLLLSHTKFGTLPPKKEIKKSPNLLYILRDRHYMLMVVIMVIYVGVEAGYCFYEKQYFIASVNSEQLGATGLSVFWAAMVISRLLLGMRPGKETSVLTIFSAGMFVSLLLLLIVPNAYLKLVFSGLFGFFCGPIWPTIFTLCTKQQSQFSGTASSFIVLSGSLGGMLFAPALGLISREPENILWMMLTLPAAMILLSYLNKQLRQGEEQAA